MQDPLPRLPIPLKAPDADILIDLGEAFRVAFRRGRYARSLAYGGVPPVTIDPKGMDWIRARAKGEGR